MDKSKDKWDECGRDKSGLYSVFLIFNGLQGEENAERVECWHCWL